MRTWVVAICSVLVVGGCGNDDVGPTEAEKACQELEAKLQKCGLTSGGTCNSQEPCVVKCALNAECAQISQRPPTGSYLDCIAVCSGAGPDDFICKDGTQFVRKPGVCDGQFHCRDGSDEENCGWTDAGPG
jgi:hypothetical protein